MEKVVKINIVREDNESLLIDNTTFVIPSDGISGIDFAEWNLYSQPAAFKDGSIITGRSYSSRPIGIKFNGASAENGDAERDAVRTFLNPKMDYSLYITYRGITRWIPAAIEKVSIPPNNVYERLKAEVNFFCADPFFRNLNSFGKDIGNVIPRWGFPFIATQNYDPVMSVYEFSDYIEIPNDGDEETFFTCKMTFMGSVTNPILYWGYKEKKFELTGTFTADDIVIVDFENKKITKNGINWYHYMTKDSTLNMMIPVGGALLSMDARQNPQLMHCYINYYQRYGGL